MQELRWFCCRLPAPADASLPVLWPRPVPAAWRGSAPFPSSCQRPALLRDWHRGAQAGPAGRAASEWRAAQDCRESAATAPASWSLSWRQQESLAEVPGRQQARNLELSVMRLFLILLLVIRLLVMRLLVMQLLVLKVLVEMEPAQGWRCGRAVEMVLLLRPGSAPPAVPAAAPQARGAVERSDAAVAPTPAIAPAIAEGANGRWIWPGRGVDRGTEETLL